MRPFFAGIDDGLVVDVGAADGLEFSNSRELIERGWRAILIEPEPVQFEKLANLYADNHRVKCLKMAVSPEVGFAKFYPCELASTLSEVWKAHIEGKGFGYSEPIEVLTTPLSMILDAQGCGAIDFLTIDAEGMDLAVMQSNDWTRHRPRLVCAESGSPVGGMTDYMATVGYVYHAHSRGNTLWRIN